MVECITFLLRIQEAPVQILAWRPSILTEGFCGFPQSIQANALQIH
jgi:hypothetical protein